MRPLLCYRKNFAVFLLTFLLQALIGHASLKWHAEDCTSESSLAHDSNRCDALVAIERRTTEIFISFDAADPIFNGPSIIEATVSCSSGMLAPSSIHGVAVQRDNLPCVHCVQLRGCSSCIRGAFAPLLYTSDTLAVFDLNTTIKLRLDAFEYSNSTIVATEHTEIPVLIRAVNDPPTWQAPALIEVMDKAMPLPINLFDSDVRSTDIVGISLSVERGAIAWNASDVFFLNATLAEINMALATLIYAPAPGYWGLDMLHLHASDNGHFGIGGPQTADQEITLHITAPNVSPIIHAPTSIPVVTGTSILLDEIVDIEDANREEVLTLSLETLHGRLEASSRMPVVHILNKTTEGRTLHFRASAEAMGSLLNAISYKPCTSCAADSLKIEVADSETLAERTVKVSIEEAAVTDEDNPPYLVVSNSLFETMEDTVLRLSSALEVRGGKSAVVYNLSIGIVGDGSLKFPCYGEYTRNAGTTFIAEPRSRLNGILNELEYHPASDSHGLEYVVAAIAGLPHEARIAILTHAVDDPILVAAPGRIEVSSGNSLKISPPITIEDVDNPNGQFNISIAASFGKLTIPDHAAHGVIVDVFTTTTLQMRGALRWINAALKLLHYESFEDFFGSDEVSIVVEDMDSSNNAGGHRTNTSIVLILVHPAEQDSPLNILVSRNIGHCVEDLICNLSGIHVKDSSPQDPLTVNLSVSHGTLRVIQTVDCEWIQSQHDIGSGVHSYGNLIFRAMPPIARIALESLEYRADANWFGTDVLHIIVSQKRSSMQGGFVATRTASTEIFVEADDDPPELDVTPIVVQVRPETPLELARVLSVGDIDSGSDESQLLRIDITARSGRLSLPHPAFFGISTTWNGAPLAEGTNSIGMIGSVSQLNEALMSTIYRPAVPMRYEDDLDIWVYDISIDNYGRSFLGLSKSAKSLVTFPTLANTAPTLARVDGLVSMLHADGGHALALPCLSVEDAEATAFKNLVDVNITSQQRGSKFQLATHGLELLNVSILTSSEYAASLTFSASPEDATSALCRTVYIAPAHICGFDFLHVQISDRGIHGDNHGARSTIMSLDVKINHVNHPPEAKLPLHVTTTVGQEATLHGILLSDIDDQAENCGDGDSTLQVRVSIENCRLQIQNTPRVQFFRQSESREMRAIGQPTDLTLALQTMRVRDCPVGEHRLNLSVVDGGGAYATIPSIDIHVRPLSVPVTIGLVADVPLLISFPEDTRFSLKGVFDIQAHIPFELTMAAMPGSLYRNGSNSATVLVVKGYKEDVISELEFVEYEPPEDFTGIIRVDAIIGKAIATVHAQVYPVNDTPQIICHTSSVTSTLGTTSQLVEKFEVRDNDAQDMLTAEISVSLGGLVPPLNSIGVHIQKSSSESRLKVIGMSGSLATAISAIKYNASTVGDGMLFISIRDQGGLQTNRSIPITVNEPANFASLVLRSENATYVKSDEDVLLHLNYIVEIRETFSSPRPLSLTLEAHSGSIVSTTHKSDDKDESIFSPNLALELDVVLSPQGFNVTVIRSTSTGLVRALAHDLAYLPHHNFNGLDMMRVSLADDQLHKVLDTLLIDMFIEQVPDAPILVGQERVQMKYRDRECTVAVSVTDADENDIVDVYAFADYGNLTYGDSNIQLTDAVRFVEPATPPQHCCELSCPHPGRNRGAVRISGTARAVSSISSALRYFPHPAHIKDRVAFIAFDSFQLCSSRAVVVDVKPDGAILRVAAVLDAFQGRDAVLLSISEDASWTRLPALRVALDGMQADEPNIVNISIECRFGEISVDPELLALRLESMHVWRYNSSLIGFSSILADADLILGALMYRPLPDFFGNWEPHTHECCAWCSNGTDASPWFSPDTARDVESECRLLEMKRRSMLEKLEARIAPIHKSSKETIQWTASTWRITVKPVNDAPVLTSNSDIIEIPVTAARRWWSVAAMAKVSLGDADAGFLDLTVTAFQGSVKLFRPTGVKILHSSIQLVAFRGSAEALMSILRDSLQYSPPNNDVDGVNDTLHLAVRDYGGCGSGLRYVQELFIKIKMPSPPLSLTLQGPEDVQIEEDHYLRLPAISLRVCGKSIASSATTMASDFMHPFENVSKQHDIFERECLGSDSGNNPGSTVSLLRLKGRAQHGHLAIYEEPDIEVHEPPQVIQVHILETSPSASEDRVDEIWSIETHTPWQRAVQRLTVSVVDNKWDVDHVLETLRLTSLDFVMTHRNRRSAASATIGANSVEASTSIAAALEELESIGRILVSTEEFGAKSLDQTRTRNVPVRATATFLITFAQNDPVPLLEVAVADCGHAAGRVDLDDDDEISYKCSAIIKPIQHASTVPETQRVIIRSNGTMTEGSFSLAVFLKFPEAFGHASWHTRTEFRTTPIPFNASASEVRSALEGLPAVGLVQVVRSKLNEAIVLADDCWCGSCESDKNESLPSVHSNVTNTSLPSQSVLVVNATSTPTSIPSANPTSNPSRMPPIVSATPTIACKFFPFETAWDITFLTLEYDIPPVAIEWADGSSIASSRSCEACAPLRPGWPTDIAALAGVNPAKLGAVSTLTNGTMPLGGEFSLSTGVKTTSLISVFASSSQMKSALSALDVSWRMPGALTVSRSSKSAEGTLIWRVTFNSQLGSIPMLSPTNLHKLTGTGVSVLSQCITQAKPPDGTFTLVVHNGAASAPTRPIAVAATADNVREAITESFVSVRAFTGSEMVSITSGSLNDDSTRANWKIVIPSGFGERPAVTVGATGHLRKGLAIELKPAGIHQSQAASFLLAGAAAMPPVIREEQVLSCFLATPREVDTFRLKFRGLISPPINVMTAPNTESLPPCHPSVRVACQGDGSSLEEILNTWFANAQLTTMPKAVTITSSSSTICSMDGHPHESTITFLGDDVVGDIENFEVESNVNVSTNMTRILVTETVRGSYPFVSEVQVVKVIPSTNHTNSSIVFRGWFSLSFRGAQTAPLSLNSSAVDIKLALGSLSTVNGNVEVSRQNQREAMLAWSVTFTPLPPTQGRLPLMQHGYYSCDENHIQGCVREPHLLGTSIEISRMVNGLAPAWGSFKLRIMQHSTRLLSTGSRSSQIRLDSQPDEIQAALRRLPGAQNALVYEEKDMLFTQWGRILAVEGLDADIRLDIVETKLEGAVTWCQKDGICSVLRHTGFESAGVWPGCAVCLDEDAPPKPSLRIAMLRESVEVRGTPSSIATVLRQCLFRGEPHYNSQMDGLAYVSWSLSLHTSMLGNVSTPFVQDVRIDAVNDPPVLSLPHVEPIIEDTPTTIGKGIVVFDADDGELSKDILIVEISAAHGNLFVPSTRRLHVRSGYRNGGSAGPSNFLELSGRPAALTRALSELVYEPKRNWASRVLQTEVQRVTVKGPDRSVAQIVETGTTGGGLIVGNFSLTLDCSYVDAALKRLTTLFMKQSSNVTDILQLSVRNKSITFVVAANAPASNPRQTSLEGKLQSALDYCSSIAVESAQAAGLSIVANLSDLVQRHTKVEVAVWRSPRRERDHSYLWELIFLNAPDHFPVLEVVTNNLTGLAVGLSVASNYEGQLFIVSSPGARPWVNVTRIRESVEPSDAWFTLQHACCGSTGTTSKMPLNVSSDKLSAALDLLPSIGSVQVRADEAASHPLQNIYAWQIEFLPYGKPAHIGIESNLVGNRAEGVFVAIEKIRPGRATQDQICMRVTDQEGSTEQRNISIIVRPVHDAPQIQMASRNSGIASGIEDVPIFDLFDGISLLVDGDGRPDYEVYATLKVKCERACTIKIPPIPAKQLSSWKRDVDHEESENFALVLHGPVGVLESLARKFIWEPEPDFFGIEIVTLDLVDALGLEATKAKQSVLVNSSNDPPTIHSRFQSLPIIVDAAPAAKSAASNPLSTPYVANVEIADWCVFQFRYGRYFLSNSVCCAKACETGVLKIRAQSRRTIALWSEGDDDSGSHVLDARGLVSAWNDALHFLEYEASETHSSDVIAVIVADSHGAVSNMTLPVRIRLESCLKSLRLSVREPLSHFVSTTAHGAAAAMLLANNSDIVKIAVVTEGTMLSLDGLELTANCVEATSLRAVFTAHSVDDTDDPKEGAAARLTYTTAIQSIAKSDDNMPGSVTLTATALSVEAAVLQLNSAFSHVTYQPPPNYDGLARLVVTVEATGRYTPGPVHELWLAIADVNDQPQIRQFGPTVVAASMMNGSLPVQALSRADPGLVTPMGADLWVLADHARDFPPIFQGNGGRIMLFDDDVDGLLTVEAQVSWMSKDFVKTSSDKAIANDGSIIALSLEAGCALNACGALHFLERLGRNRGHVTGSHTSLRFVATIQDANRALAALRVVALGDYEACWRSVDSGHGTGVLTARRAILTLGVIDSAGLADRKTFQLRVLAPPHSPFELDGDRQLVRALEDGSSLLHGLTLRNGIAIATASECANDEIVEVKFRSRHGKIAESLDLVTFGISSTRRGDEVVFRGSRSAISQLLSSANSKVATRR